MKRFLLLATLVITSPLTQAQDCFFDHQVLTLPEVQYEVLERTFSNPSLIDKIGAKWQLDPSGAKGFLIFPNQTYLEVWNQAKFDQYGNQDVFRTLDFNKLKQFAVSFGRNVSQFGTIGKRGVVGDPDGGMFYIYNGQPSVSSSLPGIERITKVTSLHNINSLKWEYGLCQLNTSSLGDGITVTGANGVRVEVTRALSVRKLGKVSMIEFATDFNHQENIDVYQDDSIHISIEFKNNLGALNFIY